jgi:hypothetical protein
MSEVERIRRQMWFHYQMDATYRALVFYTVGRIMGWFPAPTAPNSGHAGA